MSDIKNNPMSNVLWIFLESASKRYKNPNYCPEMDFNILRYTQSIPFSISANRF